MRLGRGLTARTYRNAVIEHAPDDDEQQRPRRRGAPTPSTGRGTSAENATPNSDSVATIGDTTDTVPR